LERCTISRHNPSHIGTSNTPARVRAPRMRQYPNANSEDVREERDSEEGYNSRGEDGWCEPRGLPMEKRETIKKHSKTTTSDARWPLRRKFLLRRPVFGRAYRANVLQVNILINLQFGPADVFRFVCTCLHPGLHAGRGFVEQARSAHTHPAPACAFSAARVSNWASDNEHWCAHSTVCTSEVNSEACLQPT